MRFWQRLRFYQRRAAFEHELEDEMRCHLEMKEQEQLERGKAPEEAASAARRLFGNRTFFHEESRKMWTFHLLENLAQDLRYTVRVLRHSPGFTAAAVLTLALGIGANTAIFTLIDALMLRPLPIRSPGELVALSWGNPGRATQFFTYPQFEQLRDRAPLFSGGVAWDRARFHVAGTDGAGSRSFDRPVACLARDPWVSSGRRCARASGGTGRRKPGFESAVRR